MGEILWALPTRRTGYKRDAHSPSRDYDYQVSLLTTPCNLGGIRYWFACPTCLGRVGVIYLAPGDIHFRCRPCNNLSYHSRNESSPFGILGVTERKIEKLRSEIKRWTWRGRPTRKVRRLRAPERKMGMLSVQADLRCSSGAALLRFRLHRLIRDAMLGLRCREPLWCPTTWAAVGVDNTQNC